MLPDEVALGGCECGKIVVLDITFFPNDNESNDRFVFEMLFFTGALGLFEHGVYHATSRLTLADTLFKVMRCLC